MRHADLPDAGRTSHYLLDLLADALQGNAPLPGDLVLPVGNALYFLQGTNTAKDQNGNWRIIVSGDDLCIQVRVSGTWTTEARFTP